MVPHMPGSIINIPDSFSNFPQYSAYTVRIRRHRVNIRTRVRARFSVSVRRQKEREVFFVLGYAGDLLCDQ